MNSPSFIEYMFQQFVPLTWSNGLSLYRSNAVSLFKFYNDVVSARVKTGIGEHFEVRLKLHSQGKFVQWMECSCLPNRKRGEKCSHLAAFSFALCSEFRQKLETQFHINVGDAPSFSFPDSKFNPVSSVPEKKETKTSLAADLRPDLSELSKVVQLSPQKVMFDRVNILIFITFSRENSKSLVYTFNIDDISRIVEQFPVLAQGSDLPQVTTEFYAKRHFYVYVNHTGEFVVTKRINILNTDGEKVDSICYQDVNARSIGRGVFYWDEKFITVPFKDFMSSNQVTRFDEYPQIVALNDDIFAEIVQSKFERLKQTAAVELDVSVAKLSVESTLSLEMVSLRQLDDGSVLMYQSEYPDRDSNDANLLVRILQARQQGKRFVRTKAGWFKIESEFEWLFEKFKSDGKLKLSPLEFLKFQGLVSEQTDWECLDQFTAQLKSGFKSIKDLEFPPVDSGKLKLRSYQYEGFKWLWWLYKNYFGGLLADEMGLGKTHQSMALLLGICEEDPGSLSLVVCPTSVIDHWVDKLNEFVPNIESVTFHGAGRRFDSISGPLAGNYIGRVVVTSYGILLRDCDYLAKIKWKTVILDEAHLVKNQSTRTYRAAYRIPSRMRLCLTGTPLENDLLELKNLFDYIAPNYLGPTAAFKKRYLTDSGHMTKELELQRLIHPFKMRRRKKEVLSELPEKIEDTKHCRLNALQHRLYTETLNLRASSMIEILEAGSQPIPFIHIFSVISLLKQICNDPGLIDPAYDSYGSGKLDLFDSILEEALSENQKVVVFSQYAKMIERLSHRLKLKNISHVTLTGSTLDRGRVVKSFQENDNIKVFLGSLLAGGTGIDLTSANVVIHFDRWWNAAKENQATDRIHRIGQVKNVQVFKLVTKGTLEERIDTIIQKKNVVFEKFIEQDNEVFKHLSREDLLSLLEVPETKYEEEMMGGLSTELDGGPPSSLVPVS
jgi:superfamily II DNA or RNA helicase